MCGQGATNWPFQVKILVKIKTENEFRKFYRPKYFRLNIKNFRPNYEFYRLKYLVQIFVQKHPKKYFEAFYQVCVWPQAGRSRAISCKKHPKSYFKAFYQACVWPEAGRSLARTP